MAGDPFCLTVAIITLACQFALAFDPLVPELIGPWCSGAGCNAVIRREDTLYYLVHVPLICRRFWIRIGIDSSGSLFESAGKRAILVADNPCSSGLC
jgi:hypothetical protein